MWKKYEKLVYAKLKFLYPEYTRKFHDTARGIFSRRSRQIDISLKKPMEAGIQFGVVDTKCYNKKIDVKAVEAVIGLVKDVGAQFGVIVTNKGYSKGAVNRAHADLIHTEIVLYSDWEATDLAWADEIGSIWGYNLVLRCLKCNRLIDFSGEELSFDVAEVDEERAMGSEIIHAYSWEGYCPQCNKQISFSLEIIEYPLGFKQLGNAESKGCEIVKCPRFYPS